MIGDETTTGDAGDPDLRRYQARRLAAAGATRHRDREETIRAAAEAADDDLRAVLAEAYAMGLSHRELAAIVGRSHTWIRRQLTDSNASDDGTTAA